MPRTSAGLLPYRWRGGRPEVFLVHPGGPFWANREMQAWSLAKGEVEGDEDLLTAAYREFLEETGLALTGTVRPLAQVRQPGGKTVHAWAIEAELDPAAIRSNVFQLEWPPNSGQIREFPEADRAAWFGLPEARTRINKGQLGFLDELETVLNS